MPILLNEEDGGKVLIVHVSGKLTKADYHHFAPKFERLVRHHGKLRVLFDMTDFHGWEDGALRENIKFDLKYFGDIERIAMVGEKKWQHGVADVALCLRMDVMVGEETWQHGLAMFFTPFTVATLRYFDQADAAEARKWLGEA
jgi:hypothetical protein